MRILHSLQRTIPLWLVILGCALIAFATSISGGAESSSIRLAVGPFFAPEAHKELQTVGSALPDLLTAELSHQSRFQLVERDKVNAIWNELHLTSSGLA